MKNFTLFIPLKNFLKLNNVVNNKYLQEQKNYFVKQKFAFNTLYNSHNLANLFLNKVLTPRKLIMINFILKLIDNLP
jgi:hypothetical protein